LNETLEEIVAERTGKLIRKNEELERLSVTDRLTGLFNRLYLDRVLEREQAAAVRHFSHFALILIDVDHFKRVNDTYGHHAGDEVLVTIARILAERTRDCDVAGRWGGEEFLVICPNTYLDGAMTAAEALRLSIESIRFTHVGSRTASFGVVEYQPGESIIETLERADKALYQAKTNGRNRVVAG
jgi:diguanylate cyclase (GGDEF)-like protein